MCALLGVFQLSCAVLTLRTPERTTWLSQRTEVADWEMQNCTWPHGIKQHQMATMAVMALSSPASFCGRAGSPLIRAATLDHGFMGPMPKKNTFFCKNKHKSSKSIYHSQATVRTPSICLAPAMALTLTWASCMATEILTTRHILVVLELTCPPHPLKHWSEQESSASPAFFWRPLSLRYWFQRIARPSRMSLGWDDSW